MQVQKLEKEINIGDSAATSNMTSDMTGLYNLQKISSSVMIEMDRTPDALTKACWMSFVSRAMDQLLEIHGKLKLFHN